MKKIDLLLALIIGEICAWLMWLIAKNLAIEVPGMAAVVPYLNYLLVFFPLACALGLFFSYILSKILPVFYQAAKFILVGGTNFLIDMAALNFLVFYTGIATGFDQSVFKAISFSAAVINSYFWNKFWTFERRNEKSASTEFLQFVTVSFVGFLINLGVDYAVVNLVNPSIIGAGEKTWAQVGALVAAIIALFWNFLGYKFIVFKEKINNE